MYLLKYGKEENYQYSPEIDKLIEKKCAHNSEMNEYHSTELVK